MEIEKCNEIIQKKVVLFSKRSKFKEKLVCQPI